MDTSNHALQQRLSELDAIDTVSAFSRTFYRLIAGLVAATEGEGSVRVALAGLLEVELRYHRELEYLAEREQVELTDLQSASEKHRVGLHAVREYTQRLRDLDVLDEAARALVLAECSYHLRDTSEVVDALERAVDLGFNQPLVQFALGYNRYLLALETCTDAAEAGEARVVHDPGSFRLQCLQAVSAMEEGLQDSELDSQLYWWIGVILEAAGLTEAAQDAYDKSADLLQDDVTSWEGEPAEQTPGSQAITDAEIAQAGELLASPLDPATLHNWEQDDR
jgi:tetratricopeptide (TPR) repeat protein